MFRIGKSSETTEISGCLGPRLLGEAGRRWAETTNAYGVSFWGGENVLKFIVVMVAAL